MSPSPARNAPPDGPDASSAASARWATAGQHLTAGQHATGQHPAGPLASTGQHQAAPHQAAPHQAAPHQAAGQHAGGGQRRPAAQARPRRPTMVDVARHAGVSLKTVSRVVNHEPAVAQHLVERVLAAIAELGFRRNDIARNLRSGRVNATIGLLIEEIANPFYAAIAGIAAQVAALHETLLITASSEEDADRERQVLLELCQRRVDGLLVVPAGRDHSYLRREIEMGMPVVFLDRPPGQLRADTVLLDNCGGARAGMARLLADGHTRVAVLMDSPAVYTMSERLRGARTALADAGVPEDLALVREGVKTPEDAAGTVAALLDGPRPPTAFLAANNRITVGALQELWRRSSTAPLVGFDDFEMSHLMPRPVTIIGYDPGELGRAAAELLFRRIDGDRSPPVVTVLPTRLVERGTRPAGWGAVDPVRVALPRQAGPDRRPHQQLDL